MFNAYREPHCDISPNHSSAYAAFSWLSFSSFGGSKSCFAFVLLAHSPPVEIRPKKAANFDASMVFREKLIQMCESTVT